MKSIFLSLAIISLLVSSCGNSENTTNTDSTKDTLSVSEIKTEVTGETENKESFILEDLLSINSEAELKEKFGAENVKQSEEWFAEGTVRMMLTVIFPETEKELKFSWKDDSVKFEGLTSISLEKANSPWKNKDGITVGTRMNELVKLNGKEFEFAGFGWDYSGSTNFKEGKLAREDIGITLGAIDENYDTPAYSQLLGDGMFKTDSPEAKAYNPAVVSLSVFK